MPIKIRKGPSGPEVTVLVPGDIPANSAMVKVSIADTTPDFLNAKILAGSGLVQGIAFPAGNEKVALAQAAVDRVRAYLAIPQILPDAVQTQVALDTIDYDTAGYNALPNFVVPVGKAGFYELVGSANMGVATAALLLQVGVFVNGNPVAVESQSITQAVPGLTLQGIVTTALALADGDTVGLYVLQQTGLPQTLSPFSFQTFLQAIRVSP